MVTKNDTTDGRSRLPQSQQYLPVPDPTVLTTQALQREIAASQQLAEVKLIGQKEVLETRITGVESTMRVIEDRVNILLDRANHEVKQLQSLHETKFGAIQMQFEDRDKRAEVLGLADKTAIAAALQAQKEAVTSQNVSNAVAAEKSELNFTKQIEQLQSIVNTITRSTEEKITDIKGRLDAMTGKATGSSDTTSFVIGVAAIIISFGSLFFLVFSHIQNPPSYPTAQTK